MQTLAAAWNVLFAVAVLLAIIEVAAWRTSPQNSASDWIGLVGVLPLADTAFQMRRVAKARSIVGGA
jgi:hypothetical protein